VGRITEAESAIAIVLSSPFAPAYPEWNETHNEIEQKRNYPDPSHCFIDRSRTEPEAIQGSASIPLVKAETALEPECTTNTIPVRASTFCRFVGQLIYQRPITLPNADETIIPGGSAKSFLQCLGRCIQPRAPPAS
jgi:hypothetical protein